jgi:hypothetical protein
MTPVQRRSLEDKLDDMIASYHLRCYVPTQNAAEQSLPHEWVTAIQSDLDLHPHNPQPLMVTAEEHRLDEVAQTLRVALAEPRPAPIRILEIPSQALCEGNLTLSQFLRGVISALDSIAWIVIAPREIIAWDPGEGYTSPFVDLFKVHDAAL